MKRKVADNSRRIVTYITEDRKKQFRLLWIREGKPKQSAFARKLLKMGIEKWQNEKANSMKVKGHMGF